MSLITARLGIQQRVLPRYRIGFFDALAAETTRGTALFAGKPRRDEGIEEQGLPAQASFYPARNLHFLRGSFYLCWQMGLLKFLKDWKPEVLILETNPRTLSNPLAVRWMHTRHLPVIGWGLGAPKTGRLRGRLRLQTLRQFDALITYSEQGAAQFRELGFNPERIFVAPNAVTPRPTHAAPVRENNPAALTLLFVGRLQARKRIDLLLQACACLPPHLQPRVWIVGDGNIRSELQQLASQLYPSAQFLGSLHGEELEPYLRQADLFVLPGTGGLALQQAMSYALPVIAAEADGTQNDLVRRENGWLVQPGNLESLTQTLADALQDVARLRRMGEASYRIVSEEINLEKMVTVFAEAVKRVWAR